ncbi:MAG TPA: ABC transporter ATP-binding protein [Longimicrobiales bacterium]|nr:ABC transporter ATP-binding protein [Longimicrobiales bacterium]
MRRVLRQALDLFDSRERLRLLTLVGAILLMGVAQMLGVASILPFLSVVADPGVVHTNERLNWVYVTLGFASETSFLFALGVAVLLVIGLSNGIVAGATYMITRFTWDKNHALSVQMLERYLAEPYEFFLGRNTAKLSKNILGEVTAVVNGVLVPGLKLFAQSVLATMILVLLIALDPLLAAVAAFVLGGMYGLIYLVIRRKQLRLGRERVSAGSARYKSSSEALIGIKDVKVLGCEAEFTRRFSAASTRYTTTQASNAIISELPKFALETVAFGGVLLIVLYVLGTRGTVAELLPVIGVYVFAAYRLMPALQTIFQSLAKIRFHGPALEVLHDDLFSSKKARPTTAVAEPVEFHRSIAFRDVSFRYPTSEGWVLRHVDLEIPRNAMVGFIGSTGAGKTTLVDLLLGLLIPQEGSICVDGEPLTEGRISSWRRRVGYVPQHIFLTDDSVARNIAFGVPDAEIDLAAVERAARIANIDEFVSSLASGYDTVVGDRGVRLSGGQRQRIGIARALYRDPDVLIFDEATSALDGMTESGVMEAIGRLSRKKTIILVAHRLSTLRECDTVFMFDSGRLVDSGALHELAARNGQLQEMVRLAAVGNGTARVTTAPSLEPVIEVG